MWEIWLQIQNDQIEVLHNIIVDVTLVTRMSITTVVPTTLHVFNPNIHSVSESSTGHSDYIIAHQEVWCAIKYAIKYECSAMQQSKK